MALISGGYTAINPLTDGQQALARGAWEEARAAFKVAVCDHETPEVLECLGLAAFWLEDAAATIDARERAYRLYRARDDRAGAARVAVCLADDYLTFRGEEAVANGWLQRARRLLDGLTLSPEHGLLAAENGYVSLMARHDPVTAGRFGAEAAACGRALGLVDLEMQGLALEGLALVSMGEVAAGLSRLDEATAAATGGEMTDPAAIGVTCCYLIYACEWVRDYPRAAQWCERLQEFCTRWRFSSLLGVCRSHYAGVLLWRGAWQEAEAHLIAATTMLRAMRPPLAVEGVVRLAELRRRQGRWDEAQALLDQAELHPQALLSRGALALDRGDPTGALDAAERFLRRFPLRARTERAAGLEVLIRAHLGLGNFEAAAEAVDELQTLAVAVDTEPLHAAALAAQGALAGARGDHATARRCLEDATDLFEHSGAPFEAACLRLELAMALGAIGRSDAAVQELQRAERALRQVGAVRVADRAAALLRAFSASGGANDQPVPAGFTRREAEVLRLLARGLSNQEIAATLVLSTRTVERHISTIYEKLGAHGKVARASAASYAVHHGLN